MRFKGRLLNLYTLNLKPYTLNLYFIGDPHEMSRPRQPLLETRLNL
jgi:hypothetical protein